MAAAASRNPSLVESSTSNEQPIVECQEESSRENVAGDLQRHANVGSSVCFDQANVIDCAIEDSFEIEYDLTENLDKESDPMNHYLANNLTLTKVLIVNQRTLVCTLNQILKYCQHPSTRRSLVRVLTKFVKRDLNICRHK